MIVRNPELARPPPVRLLPDWLDNIQRLRSSYMALQMEQQRQSDLYQNLPLPSLLNLNTANSQESEESYEDNLPTSSTSNLCPQPSQPQKKTRRGRPRKHAPKIPLPPLYVFIR